MSETKKEKLDLIKLSVESGKDTVEWGKKWLWLYKLIIELLFSIVLIVLWYSGYYYVQEKLALKGIELLGLVYFIGWTLKIWFGKGVNDIRNIVMAVMTGDNDLIFETITGEKKVKK